MSRPACLMVMLFSLPAFAQEPPVADDSMSKRGLSHLASMSRTATDLHQAAAAFERSSTTWAGVVESLAKSLAKASSEFDPFGFKTAHRSIHHQSEMLQQQRELIFELQQREIDRLREENERLRRPAGKKAHQPKRRRRKKE